MMKITVLLLLTGSTLLQIGGQAQAQIQSLSYTAKPKIIQTPDNQNPKSKLYVIPKAQMQAENTPQITAKEDPLGLAASELDENAKAEMDRVFELYKTLSAQQSMDAAQKPIKTEATNKKSSDDAMRTLKPSGTVAEMQQQASPGSFASILERYHQKKSSGTTTKSLNISNPDKLGRSGLPPEDTQEDSPQSQYNQ